VKPLFIKSIKGNIFALYHPPKDGRALKGNILFIPPFAEELNRSRHMISHQARRFAAMGYGVLILDLYGTGDSEGILEDASIDIWQKDILAAMSWLSETAPAPLIFWAMRSGALIAADLIQKNQGLTDLLILWSPVTNGEKFINQFKRIKLAGQASKATSSEITRENLSSEDIIEIAGYGLSQKMIHDFSALALNKMNLPKSLAIKWLDISLSAPPRLSPAAQIIIEEWQNDHMDITAEAVKDVSFWALQEPEFAQDYSAHTLAFLKD